MSDDAEVEQEPTTWGRSQIIIETKLENMIATDTFEN